jgi:excisionase family DNA binding protein
MSQPTPTPARLTISVEEAGRMLGIGRQSAYAAVRRGDIPVIRIGRRVLVPVARLNELLGLEEEMTPAA